MRLLIAIPMLLASFASLAVIVSDPDPNKSITHCAWYMDATAREVLPAPKDASGNPYCFKDISALTPGPHSVKAAFVVRATGFEDQEGPLSQALVFTVPAKPTTAPKLKMEIIITQPQPQ